MNIYINTNDNGRDYTVRFKRNSLDVRYQTGDIEEIDECINKLVTYGNGLKTNEEIEQEEKLSSLVDTLAETTAQVVENLTDEEKEKYLEDVLEYDNLAYFEIGKTVQKDGVLYIVRQSHPKTIYEPKDLPALFKEIIIPDEKVDGLEIYEWFEPDANNYYTLGQLVRFTDGKVYESKLEVNTWSPGDYPEGWKLRDDLE